MHLHPVLCNNFGIFSPTYVLFYLLRKHKPFIFRDLATCTHVFVRTSLQPPYEGPYPVIKRSIQFLIQIKSEKSRDVRACITEMESENITTFSKASFLNNN
ncbi:hypothetical protein TNCT_514951 [Trichonephila clavata]|uniref:Uncharacterized protein n=1 Tax=Trichonephila clavata TaxID=2740835 RepID=A0A8X6IFT2_TRICU|nr:hypothetical protein TNCT_514951 [Trichonephila clavata]